jgi:hypothetical protein
MLVEGRTSELSAAHSSTAAASLVSVSRLVGDSIGDGRDTIEIIGTDLGSHDAESEVVLYWNAGTGDAWTLLATRRAFVALYAGSSSSIFELPKSPVNGSSAASQPEPLGAPQEEAVALGTWDRSRDLEAVQFHVPPGEGTGIAVAVVVRRIGAAIGSPSAVEADGGRLAFSYRPPVVDEVVVKEMEDAQGVPTG